MSSINGKTALVTGASSGILFIRWLLPDRWFDKVILRTAA
jgi:hypothetical protein